MQYLSSHSILLLISVFKNLKIVTPFSGDSSFTLRIIKLPSIYSSPVSLFLVTLFLIKVVPSVSFVFSF